MAISGLAGCGGGAGATTSSGSGGGGDTGGGGVPAAIPTMTFQVDVKSGAVTQIDNSGASASKVHSSAIFAGDAVTYNSSQLINLSDSEAGVRTLQVSITNNFGLPIGTDANGTATGTRVLFGNFTNVSGLAALRPLVEASTVAGSGTVGNTNGAALSATFGQTNGVAVDSGGAIYVADTFFNNIRKIKNGFVTTLAGGGTAGVNGSGTAAGFAAPYGLAINPVDGSIITTENTGNRIRRITPAGQVTTIAGTGTAGATEGSGSTATFSGPTGVVVGPDGTIYVADTTNNKIRKIVLIGQDPTAASSYLVSTLSGSGSAGAIDGAPGTAAFHSPYGVTLDQSGALYVADYANNKIRRIDLATGSTVTIGGTGSSTGLDGLGNVATFSNPRGITFMAGVLIVSDYGTNSLREVSLISGAAPTAASNYMVQSLAGGTAGTVDGTGTVAKFNGPGLISASGSNAVYIPDLTSRKVRKLVGLNGVFPIGSPGTSTGTTPVSLSNPTGLVSSNVFGANTPYISYPEALNSGATSHPQYWSFVIPTNVDSFQFSVMLEAATPVLAPPTLGNAIVSTLTGNTNSTGFNDGPVAQAKFGLLKYPVVDKAGNLYFTDLTNEAIRRITPDGMVSTIVGGPGNFGTQVDGTGDVAKVTNLTALGISTDGLRIYFGDSQLLRVATIQSYLDGSKAGNWFVSTIAGTAGAGIANGAGSVATFTGIESMAVDQAGNLYIAELSGNRIRKGTYKGGDYTQPSAYLFSTYAGDDSTANGAPGNTNGTGTAARFSSPRAVALDGAGNLYVADNQNFVIRKITPFQVVTTFAGSGTPGYGDGVGTAAGVKFASAYGLSVDSSGYIYVGDISNVDIRRIAPDGTVTTVAGTAGAPGAADGSGAVASFSRPAGVATTPSGNLYVCDQGAIRVIQRLIKSTGQN